MFIVVLAKFENNCLIQLSKCTKLRISYLYYLSINILHGLEVERVVE